MRTSLGELDATMLLALGYDKMEVRTALTPPVVVNLTGPTDPDTAALLQEVQPAVAFYGNAGRIQIAPYGWPLGVSENAKNAGLTIALGVGAGILGIMLFGGGLFGRRR